MSEDNIRISAGGGTSRRIAVIDYLKALSIIFVIMHRSGLFDLTVQLFLLTIDTSVPIFMILSGYVYALGSGKSSLRELYDFKALKKKFIRFTVPMAVAFVFYLILIAIGGNVMSPYKIFRAFVLGEYGQGAYYYDLMIEFVLLAPLMYFLITKLGENGVIILGLINFIFDVLCSAYGFNAPLSE